MEKKSANQLYKEYKTGGGTLSFKEWMTREKTKGFINATGETAAPVNEAMTSDINQVVSQLQAEGGAQTQVSSDYIFGINKTVLIIVGIGLVITVGIIIYKRKTAKQ